ncbi:MAG: hypothetical protein ACPLYD_11830 [Anaerolineae bacterium]
MMAIEAQIRTAIRDAVNRSTRKPFHWGGLAGYQQLEAIAQELHRVSSADPETAYLRRLAMQVDRACEKNRALANDLREAHSWVQRIADCLRYPPSSYSDTETEAEASLHNVVPLTGQQVACEMETLMLQFRPDLKRQAAQAALYGAWHRLWETWGPELLPCYDVPGFPPDNLQMEGLFGRLRRHQRRISGRKSTRELRDFGQYQVLFLAESEEELLQQLRQVPLESYYAHRRRLAAAEAPRQFLYRLHHNPVATIRCLVDRHAARRAELARSPLLWIEPHTYRLDSQGPSLCYPSPALAVSGKRVAPRAGWAADC